MGPAFPAGKARRIFFLPPPLLFLVSTSLGSLLQVAEGGGCLLQTYDFFTEESFLLLLLGLLFFFLKHSEGVYIICGKTGFLSLGRALERIAKNDILLSSLFLVWRGVLVLEAHSRELCLLVPFVRADFIDFRI